MDSFLTFGIHNHMRKGVVVSRKQTPDKNPILDLVSFWSLLSARFVSLFPRKMNLPYTVLKLNPYFIHESFYQTALPKKMEYSSLSCVSIKQEYQST